MSEIKAIHAWIFVTDGFVTSFKDKTNQNNGTYLWLIFLRHINGTRHDVLMKFGPAEYAMKKCAPFRKYLFNLAVKSKQRPKTLLNLFPDKPCFTQVLFLIKLS